MQLGGVLSTSQVANNFMGTGLRPEVKAAAAEAAFIEAMLKFDWFVDPDPLSELKLKLWAVKFTPEEADIRFPAFGGFEFVPPGGPGGLNPLLTTLAMSHRYFKFAEHFSFCLGDFLDKTCVCFSEFFRAADDFRALLLLDWGRACALLVDERSQKQRARARSVEKQRSVTKTSFICGCFWISVALITASITNYNRVLRFRMKRYLYSWDDVLLLKNFACRKTLNSKRDLKPCPKNGFMLETIWLILLFSFGVTEEALTRAQSAHYTQPQSSLRRN